MSFISLATFLALTAGTPTLAKAEAACCMAEKAKASVRVTRADGSICPITG